MTDPQAPVSLPQALTEHIGYLGVRLGQRAQRDFEVAIAPLDLVPGQYDYLATLAAHGPLAQRTLATVLGVDPARIVAMTDVLEGRGAVTRTTDPTDRRRNLVGLTRRGTTLTAKAARAAAAVEAGLTRGLSASERVELRRLLRHVALSAS